MNSHPQVQIRDPLHLDNAQQQSLRLHLTQLEDDLYKFAEFLDEAVDGDVIHQLTELSRRCPDLSHDDLVLRFRQVQRAVQRMHAMQAGVDQDYRRIADVLGIKN